jgi:hypothetical protein
MIDHSSATSSDPSFFLSCGLSITVNRIDTVIVYVRLHNLNPIFAANHRASVFFEIPRRSRGLCNRSQLVPTLFLLAPPRAEEIWLKMDVLTGVPRPIR